MRIINLAPTSLSEIRPSGETLERVRPGISRVVARILGVESPDVPILPELIAISDEMKQ